MWPRFVNWIVNLMDEIVQSYIRRLNWFRENINLVINNKISDFEGNPLVSSAKGIYKPKGIRFVLSVTITDNPKYKDGSLFNIFGSGTAFMYEQEKNNHSSYSNNALRENLVYRVPVGVFHRLDKKPNSKYVAYGCYYPLILIEGNYLFCDEYTYLTKTIEEILEECYNTNHSCYGTDFEVLNSTHSGSQFKDIPNFVKIILSNSPLFIDV